MLGQPWIPHVNAGSNAGSNADSSAGALPGVHTHVEKNDSLFLLSSLNTPFKLTPSTSPGGGMAALTTEPAEPGEDDNEAEDDEDDVIDICTSTLPGGGTAAVSPS